jgi:L-ascorbate metabolism protein UlaG (beta-lactamase superfamily)
VADIEVWRPPGRSRSWLLRWVRGLFGAPLPPATRPPPIPLPGEHECALTFLGHASLLARWRSGRALFDPCFADSLYTLRRARRAVLPDGALEQVGAILISHAHADHFHAASLERLDRASTLIVPPRCPRAERFGFARVIELAPGESCDAGGLRITAVSARHRMGLFARSSAVGYIVRGDGGPAVYFSGDTGYFSGFRQVGAEFRPDVAVLPISGYRPSALRRDHLSPADALDAFADVGAQLLVPVHHSAFALGYEPLWEPIAWLRSLVQSRGLAGRVAWLDAGESCVARTTQLTVDPRR